jgi:hypothetical protein
VSFSFSWIVVLLVLIVIVVLILGLGWFIYRNRRYAAEHDHLLLCVPLFTRTDSRCSMCDCPALGSRSCSPSPTFERTKWKPPRNYIEVSSFFFLCARPVVDAVEDELEIA